MTTQDTRISLINRHRPTQAEYIKLTEKVFEAFSLACSQNELEVAGNLLALLDGIVARPGVDLTRSHIRSRSKLLDAHLRLWGLKQLSEFGAEPSPFVSWD